MRKRLSPVEERIARHVAPWWAGPLFLFLAIALVPWIIYLAFTLPSHTQASHYRTAWVGFDVFLAMALLRTAWLAMRRRRQMELPAIVLATLLVMDAWFDVITSKSGVPQMEAVLLAVFIELPLAALAIYLSRRVERVIDSTLRSTEAELSRTGVSTPENTTLFESARDGSRA